MRRRVCGLCLAAGLGLVSFSGRADDTLPHPPDSRLYGHIRNDSDIPITLVLEVRTDPVVLAAAGKKPVVLDHGSSRVIDKKEAVTVYFVAGKTKSGAIIDFYTPDSGMSTSAAPTPNSKPKPFCTVNLARFVGGDGFFTILDGSDTSAVSKPKVAETGIPVLKLNPKSSTQDPTSTLDQKKIEDEAGAGSGTIPSIIPGGGDGSD